MSFACARLCLNWSKDAESRKNPTLFVFFNRLVRLWIFQWKSTKIAQPRCFLSLLFIKLKNIIRNIWKNCVICCQILERSKAQHKNCATTLLPLTDFYRAEEYHQQYLGRWRIQLNGSEYDQLGFFLLRIWLTCNYWWLIDVLATELIRDDRDCWSEYLWLLTGHSWLMIDGLMRWVSRRLTDVRWLTSDVWWLMISWWFMSEDSWLDANDV